MPSAATRSGANPVMSLPAEDRPSSTGIAPVSKLKTVVFPAAVRTDQGRDPTFAKPQVEAADSSDAAKSFDQTPYLPNPFPRGHLALRERFSGRGLQFGERGRILRSCGSATACRSDRRIVSTRGGKGNAECWDISLQAGWDRESRLLLPDQLRIHRGALCDQRVRELGSSLQPEPFRQYSFGAKPKHGDQQNPVKGQPQQVSEGGIKFDELFK